MAMNIWVELLQLEDTHSVDANLEIYMLYIFIYIQHMYYMLNSSLSKSSFLTVA